MIANSPAVAGDPSPDGALIRMMVPPASLGSGTGVFTVKFPFQGKEWEAKGTFFDPLAVDIQRVDADSEIDVDDFKP